jgi:hypothetical protein
MERNQEQREQRKEKYLFIQNALHAQINKDKWYIDNECSSHMIGDKKKCYHLEEECRKCYLWRQCQLKYS